MTVPLRIAFVAFLVLTPFGLIYQPEIQAALGTMPDRATANGSEMLFLLMVKLMSAAGYVLCVVNPLLLLAAVSPAEPVLPPKPGLE